MIDTTLRDLVDALYDKLEALLSADDPQLRAAYGPAGGQ